MAPRAPVATILSRLGVAPEPRSSKPSPGMPMSSTFAGATGPAATLSGSQPLPDHRAMTTATTRAAPISPTRARLDVSRVHRTRTTSAPWRPRWAKPDRRRPVWRWSMATGTSTTCAPARAASMVSAVSSPNRGARARLRSSSPRTARWPESGAAATKPQARRMPMAARLRTIPNPPLPPAEGSTPMAMSAVPASTGSSRAAAASAVAPTSASMSR